MRKTKSLMLVLTLLLILGTMLAGCKSGGKTGEKETPGTKETPKNFNATGYPIVEEPITLTMMGQASPLQPELGRYGIL